VAYFAIDEWLTGFAYRAGINPLIFVLSAAAAAAVAFSTVALQSFKTASADPWKRCATCKVGALETREMFKLHERREAR
jgi:hypothetical protein